MIQRYLSRLSKAAGIIAVMSMVITGVTDLNSQVPQGFTYQALALTATGQPMRNQDLQVRITIQSDSLGGTIFWNELHPTVTTNNSGVFSLILGKGSRIGGTAAEFADIDWSASPKFIKTEINDGSWKEMGSARLWSVPYAMVAGDVSGKLSKLEVEGISPDMDEALFVVKNLAGDTVFAVFNEGVRINVGSGDGKAAKGGFAIGSMEESKAGTTDLMRVTLDSTRIYVSSSQAKPVKGGFAIGSFEESKSGTEPFLLLTPDNYLIGHLAGQALTTGKYNSFFGYESGSKNTSGSNNAFMGYYAGRNNTIANNNVFIVNGSGLNNQSGKNNLFLGTLSGSSNISGSRNVFIGNKSGQSSQTGYSNVFIGDSVGVASTSGARNVYIGSMAAISNTTGRDNIVIGYQTGMNGTYGSQNIFIGNYSGKANRTSQNLFIGEYSGEFNTTGTRNSFIGFFAGQANVIGEMNTYVGQMAGMDNIKSRNTFVGYWAGGNNVNGQYNTFLGWRAGQANGGSNNVFLGYSAGEGNTGNGNVFVGYEAGFLSGSVSNQLYISNASGTPLIFGDFSSKYVTVNGRHNVTGNSSAWISEFRNDGNLTSRYGIRIQAGTYDASGTNYMIGFYDGDGSYEGAITLASGSLSLIQASDERLKTDIRATGINAVDLVGRLRVTDYRFRESPDAVHTGFIAQEAEKVFPEMVNYNQEHDTYGVDLTRLVPILTKAIQEQQLIIEQQNSELEKLKAEFEELKALVKSGMVR